jgi:hypothetical protein
MSSIRLCAEGIALPSNFLHAQQGHTTITVWCRAPALLGDLVHPLDDRLRNEAIPHRQRLPWSATRSTHSIAWWELFSAVLERRELQSPKLKPRNGDQCCPLTFRKNAIKVCKGIAALKVPPPEPD